MSAIDTTGVKANRPIKPTRDAGLPAAVGSPAWRRQRTLAVLALARLGFRRRYLAEWFGLSKRQVRNMLRDARRASDRMGLSG